MSGEQTTQAQPAPSTGRRSLAEVFAEMAALVASSEAGIGLVGQVRRRGQAVVMLERVLRLCESVLDEERVSGRAVTHSEGCHRWHAPCLASAVLRVIADGGAGDG